MTKYLILFWSSYRYFYPDDQIFLCGEMGGCCSKWRVGSAVATPDHASTGDTPQLSRLR